MNTSELQAAADRHTDSLLAKTQRAEAAHTAIENVAKQMARDTLMDFAGFSKLVNDGDLLPHMFLIADPEMPGRILTLQDVMFREFVKRFQANQLGALETAIVNELAMTPEFQCRAFREVSSHLSREPK